MSTPARNPPSERPSRSAATGLEFLRLISTPLRLAAFAVLRLAAPAVRLLLGSLGLLSLLIALFYRLASVPGHDPFWVLLGFSVGCGLALVLYERLLRMLA
jgi:hypothetical protein